MFSWKWRTKKLSLPEWSSNAQCFCFRSDEFKFGCTSLRVPPELLYQLRNNITVSPGGIAFVTVCPCKVVCKAGNCLICERRHVFLAFSQRCVKASCPACWRRSSTPESWWSSPWKATSRTRPWWSCWTPGSSDSSSLPMSPSATPQPTTLDVCPAWR